LKRKKRLGEMLIEEGLITEDQLKEALVEHKRAGLKLGEYLIQKGVVRESQIIDMLSRQLKIEKYDPSKYPVDNSLANILPYSIAQKYNVAPIKKKGFLLKVATVDPMDIEALDTIETHTNLEVEPVICSQRELTQIMTAIYGLTTGLMSVIGGMEDLQYRGAEEETEKEDIRDLEVTSLHDLAKDPPVVRLVNSIISQAIREGASDVHIGPEKNYVQVRFRIDGKLHDMPAPPKAMLLPLISRIKILAQMDIANTRVPQDGRFTVRMDGKEINVRASTIPTIYGEHLVLRLLDMSSGIYSLEELGMSEEDQKKLKDAIKKPYGMILSTGPTGSGKSTSLYAILQNLNSPDINIITVEDPVEYRIDKIKQVQLNRKAGMTFASALRSILRQDPDVIMVGEIRDAETASIAVQAALTGHRVLSTMHTNDAAGAITRLINMEIEPFLVSSVLLVSFAQRLVRKICPNCIETYIPSEQVLKNWGIPDYVGMEFKRGKGCPQCMNTGYRGRTGIFEVLVNDEMIQQMILERRSSQEITRVAVDAGKLRTLKEDALSKVLKGITTFEEAASAVMV